MRVQVDVEGDDPATDANSLVARLRDEPGLSGADFHVAAAFTASLTVGLLDPLGSIALVHALAVWVGSRRDVAVKVTLPNGSAVQVPANADDETLERISRAFTEPTDSYIVSESVRESIWGGAQDGHDDPDGPPGTRDSDYVTKHYSQVADPSLSEIQAILRGVDGVRPDAAPTDTCSLPITVYLSDEAAHEQVESAIEELMAAAGLEIRHRGDPIIGSWFRRMRATLKTAAHSPAVRESALVATHIADARLVLAQDAAITATLLQNLGPVIASLQPTKDAVIRVGALLVVKVDWVVNIHQLTAAQQAQLDHTPRLAASPHEIIAALNLARPTESKSNSTTALP